MSDLFEAVLVNNKKHYDQYLQWMSDNGLDQFEGVASFGVQQQQQNYSSSRQNTIQMDFDLLELTTTRSKDDILNMQQLVSPMNGNDLKNFHSPDTLY